MKADIKDGKLTITPESYSEEFALKQRKLSEEEWAGFIVFKKYDDANTEELKPDKECKDKKDGDTMVDYIESTHFVGWHEELKPDKKCKLKKNCIIGQPGVEMANLACELCYELEKERRRKVDEFMNCNQGGCVDQSIKRCENEEKETVVDNEHGKIVLEFRCADGTRNIIYDKDGNYTMVRKRGQHIMYNLNFGEIVYLLKSFCRDANLERDEILKKAHEEAESLVRHSCSVGNKYYNNAVDLAKSKAEKIIDEAREKSQEASNYYRTTCEECDEMKKDCDYMMEKTSKAVEYRQSLIDNAEDDARKIVEDAN